MRYQPAVYAADVLALMDGAVIARACFIGTSMGGLITMALAALRPLAVAAAALSGSGRRETEVTETLASCSSDRRCRSSTDWARAVWEASTTMAATVTMVARAGAARRVCLIDAPSDRRGRRPVLSRVRCT